MDLAVDWKITIHVVACDLYHAVCFFGWAIALLDCPHYLWKEQPKLFRHIAMADRQRLVERLCTEIGNAFEWGIAMKIDCKSYLGKTDQIFRSQWGSSYGFGVRHLIMYLTILLERSGKQREPINVLYEQGHKNEGHIRLMRKDFEEHLNIRTWSTGKKIGNPLLQASDVLAFSLCEVARGERSIIADCLQRNNGSVRYHILDWDFPVQALQDSIIAADEKAKRHRETRRRIQK